MLLESPIHKTLYIQPHIKEGNPDVYDLLPADIINGAQHLYYYNGPLNGSTLPIHVKLKAFEDMENKTILELKKLDSKLTSLKNRPFGEQLNHKLAILRRAARLDARFMEQHNQLLDIIVERHSIDPYQQLKNKVKYYTEKATHKNYAENRELLAEQIFHTDKITPDRKLRLLLELSETTGHIYQEHYLELFKQSFDYNIAAVLKKVFRENLQDVVLHTKTEQHSYALAQQIESSKIFSPLVKAKLIGSLSKFPHDYSQYQYDQIDQHFNHQIDDIATYLLNEADYNISEDIIQKLAVDLVQSDQLTFFAKQLHFTNLVELYPEAQPQLEFIQKLSFHFPLNQSGIERVCSIVIGSNKIDDYQKSELVAFIANHQPNLAEKIYRTPTLRTEEKVFILSGFSQYGIECQNVLNLVTQYQKIEQEVTDILDSSMADKYKLLMLEGHLHTTPYFPLQCEYYKLLNNVYNPHGDNDKLIGAHLERLAAKHPKVFHAIWEQHNNPLFGVENDLLTYHKEKEKLSEPPVLPKAFDPIKDKFEQSINAGLRELHWDNRTDTAKKTLQTVVDKIAKSAASSQEVIFTQRFNKDCAKSGQDSQFEQAASEILAAIPKEESSSLEAIALTSEEKKQFTAELKRQEKTTRRAHLPNNGHASVNDQSYHPKALTERVAIPKHYFPEKDPTEVEQQAGQDLSQRINDLQKNDPNATQPVVKSSSDNQAVDKQQDVINVPPPKPRSSNGEPRAYDDMTETQIGPDDIDP